MIRNIGTAARAEMEDMLGRRVFLDLTVKVRQRLARRREPARPDRHRAARASVELPQMADASMSKSRSTRRASCRAWSRTGARARS